MDTNIIRLETIEPATEEKASINEDTILYLNNGSQIKGKLKRETEQEVVLDVLVGNSFGTIAIQQTDIQSVKRIR